MYAIISIIARHDLSRFPEGLTHVTRPPGAQIKLNPAENEGFESSWPERDVRFEAMSLDSNKPRRCESSYVGFSWSTCSHKIDERRGTKGVRNDRAAHDQRASAIAHASRRSAANFTSHAPRT